MTDMNPKNQPHDADNAIRARIFTRATAINSALIARLATVSDDLEAGQHRAALGGLDGIEREITTLRAILLLLP